MRPAPSSMAHGASVCLAILLLAACTDSARISAPARHPDVPRALASKQSPTGGRILYTRGFVNDLYSMDDDGTNVIQLTATDGAEVDPAWAPDGKRIIYAGVGDDNTVAIYIMNADGSGVTRLTNPGPGQFDRSPQALGKRIVFHRSDGVDAYGSIWTMNDDGTDLTRLTFGSDAIQPAPSPGGKLLAFIRNGDVYVLDIETGATMNLTNTDVDVELFPSWSPNGKQIAFTREEPGGNQDLYVMNPDGTGVTRLTNTAADLEFNPRWSPDSKRIAFASTYAAFFSIWVMYADGTGLNNLSVSHTPATDEVVGAWAR